MLLVFSGITTITVTAQNAEIDSLRAVLKTQTKADTHRVNTLKGLCFAFRSIDPEKGLSYGEEALKLARKLKLRMREAGSLTNIGSIYYAQGQYDRALKYYQQSLKLFEQIGDFSVQAKNLINIGTIYYDQGQYDRALKYYQRSLKLFEQLGDFSGQTNSLNNIGNIYADQGQYDQALKYYQQSLKLSEQLGDFRGQANNQTNIGSIYYDQGQYNLALPYHQQSLKLYEKLGNLGGQATNLNNIGNIHLVQGHYDLAQAYYQRSLKLSEQLGDLHGQATSLNNIGLIYKKQGHYDLALKYYQQGLALADNIGTLYLQKDVHTNLANVYSKAGVWQQAYKHRTKAQELQDSLFSEEKTKAIQEMETKYQTEKKELQIEKQQAEIKTQEQRNQFLLGAGGLLAMVLFLVGYGYYDKRKTNQVLTKQKTEIQNAYEELNSAFEEIKQQKETIEQQNTLIAAEKQKSDDLLLNILPHETAEELKATGQATPRRYEQVSVLFTDFKGFTASSEKMTPEEVVSQLDTCFKAFDRIVKSHGLEKIKTIGDAYMCAGGLPVENPENAERMIQAGLEMQQFMAQWKAEREAEGKTIWECRLGIHSGPVVAGVVGESKFAYDIWGDTVNTAARMESSGEVGKVNISEATWQLVKAKFPCEFRGEIEAKGKGKIGMYFV